MLHKNNLNDIGIYTHWDSSDLYHAKALILGPKDTPYEKGSYFFDIKFGNNYPYEPPKV